MAGPRTHTLADAGLTLAAIGGVVCIAAVVAASVFQITLVMFSTGSMSPTIPAGSLAVVRQIPAQEAEVGDVVTVDRPGRLPITHRITSSTDAGNGFTSITMRGDANTVADPAPYVVRSVRVVLGSVPGLASAVVAVSHPLALGGITLGAALLVTWAFWPRSDRRRHRAGRGDGAQVDAQGDAAGDSARGDARRAAATALLGAVLLPAALLPALAAPQAARADVGGPEIEQSDVEETVVRGRYLTLRSITEPDAMQSMTPGRPVPWQVGVSVSAPEPGLVSLGISAEGGLVNPGALELDIRACTVRWTAGVCTAGASVWLPRQDIAAVAESAGPDGVRELDTLPASATAWLLITVVMPTEAEPGAEANLTIHAWGGSDQARVSATAVPRLADTGASVAVPATLAGAAVLGGLGLAGAARLVVGARRTGEVAPAGRREADDA